MIHRVALLAALISVTHAQAQPAAPQPVSAPEPPSERAPSPLDAEPTEPTDPTDQPDQPDPDNTALQLVEKPVEQPDPVERHGPTEAQQYAVPLPGRRSRDPALRKARGMLAGGIIFTAICGAGSVLVIVAGVYAKPRYGTDSAELVRGATALIVCTVGSIALAGYGAARIRKIRHLTQWTGGLGLRF